MPFFDPRSDPPDVDWDDDVWLSAEDRTVEGVVAVQLVLAETERAAVILTDLGASPHGLSFTRVALVRSSADSASGSSRWPQHMEVPKEGLRFGVGLADGTKVVADDFGWAEDGPGDDRAYTLLSRGGSGGACREDDRFRLAPLPEGDLRFACAWPELGVDESFAVLDGQLVAEAAAKSRLLWPDDPPGSGSGTHGGWTSGVLVRRPPVDG